MTELNKIGQVLVQRVRDEAIEQATRVLLGEHPSPVYADLQNSLGKLGKV